MSLDADKVDYTLKYLGEDIEVPIEGYTLQGIRIKVKETNPVKFVYIFVHGLTATAAFNNDFYPFISKIGGVIYSCDHVGHGRSPGERVSLSISQITDEIESLIAIANEEYPNLPIILHGHSMGSLAVLSYAFRNKDIITQKVKAIIAESSWISFSEFSNPTVLERIGLRILNCIYDTYRISSPSDLTEPNMSQKWKDIYYNSPYTYEFVTPKVIISAMDEMYYLHNNYEDFNEKLPLLFIQGKTDRLVSFQENDEWIKKLINMYPNADITYKMYDAPHCILKSKARKEEIENILDYINKILLK